MLPSNLLVQGNQDKTDLSRTRESESEKGGSWIALRQLLVKSNNLATPIQLSGEG